MKLVELKCPNCGASFQADVDQEVCFCTYCGTKSMIDNGTIHIIDEAKIREAEANEKVKLAEIEKARVEEKNYYIFIFCICLVMAILAAIMLIVLYKAGILAPVEFICDSLVSRLTSICHYFS